MTHSDLLLLASVASLHDPHQMRMLSLLLGLGTTASSASHINAVLGHDGEAWESGLSDLLGILFRRLLADSASGFSRRRGHAKRTIRRIAEVHRSRRARSIHGRAEGGLGFGWGLLKGEDIVGFDQGAGVEVDSGMVVEIDGDFGQLPIEKFDLATCS